MNKVAKRKPQSDFDVKRKAIKLVVTHLKKKLPEGDFQGSEHLNQWTSEIEQLLEKEEFVVNEFIAKRRDLNDVLERVLDVELRYKIRDSWYSLGKAIDKKVKIM